VGADTEAPEYVGGKGGGERAIFFVAAGSQDLVHGAPCESAARQSPVDRRNTERQNPMRRRRRPLDPPDALTKLRKKGPCRTDHVLFLFLDSSVVKTGA